MAAVYKSLSKPDGTKQPERLSKVNGTTKNRQRVLILTSRGVTYRHDAKLDTKTKLYQLNELADLHNCNNVFFFEARKAKDLYLWMSKAPNGPTVKMHVQNIHTMEELGLKGNCLRGSRPVLSFDATFDSQPHLLVIKELLLHIFGVPKGAHKTKPFVDHVMSFTIADGRIWTRCYHISETESSRTTENGVNGEKKSSSSKRTQETDVQLEEIGPKFVLTPIVILESSFGGPVIYDNKEFVSPNQLRADVRRATASKRIMRSGQGEDRKFKRGELGLKTEGGKKKPKDPLDARQLFT
ncbi:MAG: Ribosome biogenesis protein brx1 [Chrysothrix sp. TS-e1954]|nr:MAG: Ribosome biogenesis protein brx1 [Chrysothrix sp. TS-e1954]